MTRKSKNISSLSEQALLKKLFADIAYYEPFYLKDFAIGKKTIQ